MILSDYEENKMKEASGDSYGCIGDNLGLVRTRQ